MGDYIFDIRNILLEYLKNEYKQYLNNNKILCIKKSNINEIITSFYNNNIKDLKTEIRRQMKEKYKNDYPSGTIENIIYDLFQHSEMNIQKVINEINYLQDKNFLSLTLPIINDSLNLNISNENGYIIINHIKDTSNSYISEIYNEIIKYKFIYSINNKILDDFNEDEKINIIKNEIKYVKTITLGVYYLKNNIETL
tara:strand:+ start:12065 stop:12655 length:591 start_codon:yes stop_codon:yes gene_type:complete